MKERIGIVTGGGDCPGLNAVIYAVVKAADRRGWETLGIYGGFDGLLSPVQARPMNYQEMDGLLYLGGTVLGTSNKGRFVAKAGHGEKREIDPAVLAEAKRNFDALGLRALVVVGGDGSLSIGLQCMGAGIPIVGVPKTIDNDIDGTAVTFGFDTAVSFATDAIDRLRTHAESHKRVIVVEMMGRYAGWIAAHAGIAGGASVVLIPEIEFTYESIVRKIVEREAEGRHFTMVVVAEGARQKGGDFTTHGGPEEKNREARLGGISAVVAEEIGRRTGKEVRNCVLGHLQRGGVPTTFDRLLCTRFGANAVRLIDEGCYGHMVASRPPDIVPIPIADAVGKLKTVPTDGDLIRTGRALGICWGD
ncbi:MAG: ATP-dependent 6-phosphofructokinase [Opitutae bacterium]|nr:ATP-dependent 6-phosphofructokinase [Opitutae bacterium]